jgi:hypothetical protein
VQANTTVRGSSSSGCTACTACRSSSSSGMLWVKDCSSCRLPCSAHHADRHHGAQQQR